MTKEQLYAHAKEQEEKVRIVLANVADMTTLLDVVRYNGECTSSYIDYDEQDAFNAIKIFYSIASNYAIKHGKLTTENVSNKISLFREMVKDVFGIDTIQETQISLIMEQAKNCIGGNK